VRGAEPASPATRSAYLPASSRQAVADVIARAQTRSERLVSLARLLLVCGSFARTAWMWAGDEVAPPADRLALALVPALAVIGFSLWVLVAFRERVAPAPLFSVSVALDALLCFVSLANNSLTPSVVYPGLLAMPDLGALLVITAIAGLRLSTPAALVAGALNGASFAALVLLDRSLHGLPKVLATDPIGMFALLLFAATALAVLVARTARALVQEGALRALEAERAERGLGVLLQEHHDLRSMLSAAALDADLLLREIAAPRRGDAAALEGVARELREGLVRVNEHVAAIREHAYGELEVLRGPAPVSLVEAATGVRRELAPLFPATKLELGDELDGIAVWAAGGALALHRVLLNLATNACEGDGRPAARTVALRAEVADGGELVRIAIEDDGPGFPEAILATPLERRRTSKPEGSGLGLLIVSALLGPHAQTLRRANRPGGGARVSFELPAASPR
jgi:signal transduction histidine kinase